MIFKSNHSFKTTISVGLFKKKRWVISVNLVGFIGRIVLFLLVSAVQNKNKLGFEFNLDEALFVHFFLRNLLFGVLFEGN